MFYIDLFACYHTRVKLRKSQKCNAVFTAFVQNILFHITVHHFRKGTCASLKNVTLNHPKTSVFSTYTL